MAPIQSHTNQYPVSEVVNALAIRASDPGSIPLHGQINFQNYWGHQTSLFKISNLLNHLTFKGSNKRVIDHINGLSERLPINIGP